MITRLSPAKINLVLKVLRRREDGYHDILSLMQAVSLCDELDFQRMGGGIHVCCPDSVLPTDRGNLITRAADAFFTATAIPPDIEIILRKRIPIAAGLGGGSSNAATTLMALNELFGHPLTRRELQSIGARLGADIPFFIFGTRAWVSGIGDRLTEAPPLPPLHLLLVNPGFAVSTRLVYEGLNLGLTNGSINYSVPRFFTVVDLCRGLANDLEQVTLKLHPVLERIKTLLMRYGACGALMSGSGPTVFGLFETVEAARGAENRLREEGCWSLITARFL
jgi:4-diphosphocytidyl-2-C-methyl-D-erythritol kinase